jgi:serine/threonine protein kinase
VGAVTYVHNKSCVHRDLKLENILLDKHGDVKLVDFGFTREYEGKSNYLQTWCGTVCYSAPEMLKGEKYAGEKVDVWSLGIILYALLVGELPFDEDDENVTKMKILKEEPKYPENFPPQARELCQSLLSKRPILRTYCRTHGCQSMHRANRRYSSCSSPRLSRRSWRRRCCTVCARRESTLTWSLRMFLRSDATPWPDGGHCYSKRRNGKRRGGNANVKRGRQRLKV